ncbi:hypothetical protein [Bordetella pseudohinzii]|uniref:hypothetical protein n=1 Tax=Bordetella pseudohinzii TaxID=1331258 RepID=UPI00103E1BB7|nr:hypothetical protein [Bordetella pseudohinzii]
MRISPPPGRPGYSNGVFHAAAVIEDFSRRIFSGFLMIEIKTDYFRFRKSAGGMLVFLQALF